MSQDSGAQFGALGDNFKFITKLLPLYAAFMSVKNAPDTRSRILAFLDLAQLGAELTPTATDDQIVAALKLATANESLFVILIAFIDRQFSAQSEGRFGAATFGAEEERELSKAGVPIGMLLLIAQYLPALLAFLNSLRDGDE